MIHSIAVIVYLVWAAPASPLAAFAPLPENDYTKAGLTAEGPALLAYLQARLIAPGDAERLARLVRELGDRSFSTRQRATKALIAAGPKAAPFLRKGLTDADAEVRRRANSCLQSIEKQMAILSIAVHGIMQMQPSDATSVLLGITSIGDDELFGTVLSALSVLAIRRGPDATLIAALRSPEIDQRAAAALTFGRFGG